MLYPASMLKPVEYPIVFRNSVMLWQAGMWRLIYMSLAPVPEVIFQTCEIHAHHSWPFVRRLGISPRMRRALATAAKTAQIMHNHSLWMLPNIYPASAVKGTRCRLITSLHGSLSEYMVRAFPMA